MSTTKSEKGSKGSGGWSAISSSFKHLREQGALLSGSKALLRLNKNKGVDCPGCAWPDPQKSSPTEFCENGAKAIAAESSSGKADELFFKNNTISFLNKQTNYWLEQQGRLTQPMYKPAGSDKYEAIDWESAFDKVAGKLNGLTDANRAAFYTSGRTSNEAAFLYQLLGRSLGTNNFPDCSNMCHESSGVALTESIGIGKGTVTLEDFDKAELIVVAGQNPATNHPRMLIQLRDAVKRGAQIVFINPIKEGGMTGFTHPQDVLRTVAGVKEPVVTKFVQPVIGGDQALVQGISKYLLEHEGVDKAFIEAETVGFDEFAQGVSSSTWDIICRESGLSREEIEELGALFEKSKSTIFCWAMGLTQHVNAVATLQDVTNLMLMTGNIGKPGAGLCPVRGHSNVQGDRTMGINHNPPEWFLEALDKTFSMNCSRVSGFESVELVHAMKANSIDVFMGLGGNYVSAMCDTGLIAEGMSRCDLTVHVSTKLNRSHLITGKEALILPCLGRTEKDKGQFLTVENSMSVVHQTAGVNKPASDQLKSEVEIICGIGAKLKTEHTIDWLGLAHDYSKTRDLITKVVRGFKKFEERIEAGRFYLGNSAAEYDWKTSSGKAQFMSHRLHEAVNRKFTLMTIRSHDQYNTTVYGLNDRYRGIAGQRNVLFISESDLIEYGWEADQQVEIVNTEDDSRVLSGLELKVIEIAKGNMATYFPEANALYPIDHVAKKSNTPASKCLSIEVRSIGP